MHILILMMFTLYEPVTPLNNEIKEMFRDKYCIEGMLVTTPTGPTVITDVPILKQAYFDPVSPSIIEADALNSHFLPAQNTQQLFNNNLINTKGKTPMCLINELAQYNKMQYHYRLINEQGPAQQKLFTVTLTLGSEEYEAEGISIKKAQHSAAAKALSNTQFKHPPQITSDECTASKSPISLVNEIAQKRNRDVIFKVVSEKGPPHMKVFKTVCRVEGLVTEGEGKSKKISKTRAAEKMLNMLMQLPKVDPIPRIKRKRTQPKKKNRNLIKGNKVSDLIDALFAMKPERKLTSPVDGKIQKKNGTSTRVRIANNWQLMPELMKEQVSISSNLLQNKNKFLKAGTFSTVDAGKSDVNSAQPANKKSSNSKTMSSKDQLMQLAQLLDMQVEFSELSQANKMYSTLVSLSITPSYVCYGEGPSTQASHEKAAFEMLAMLSKLGLDNFISKKDLAFADILYETENLVMIESVMR